MCPSDLRISASCGHKKDFHPRQHYLHSPTQNRRNGTASVLPTTTTDAPALCVRCASRVAANIVRERNLVTAELETHIAAIDAGLWAERKRPFNYVALIFERARLRLAVGRFWEEREEELAGLRGMHGRFRWDRVAVLRDDECRVFQTLSDSSVI